MREVLYRGKRKDNGKWVQGSLIMRKMVDEPDADIAYYPEDHEGGEHYLRVSPVIPETVG
jgi:hypothetical protein